MSDALDTTDVPEILRYWLAMVRHEEALGAKLRAAPRARPRPVDLVEPRRGQTYVKLLRGAPDPLGFLLRDDRALVLPLDAERAAFFEHWLHGVYRRERFARGASAATEDGDRILCGFPVLFDARRGELDTLLRFPVDALGWRDATGNPWSTPPARQRTGAHPPSAPRELVIGAEPAGEEGLPYALNEVLATRVLGVQDEDLAPFLADLRGRGVDARAMVDRVLELLGAPTGEDPLEALARAVGGRAAPGIGVWPIGLVWDGGNQFATHYLQRDLREMLQAGVRPRTGYGAYMTGTAAEAGWAPLVAGRTQSALTEDQRRAGELFLGSPLAAVKGPPGTGKTELILGLAVHALVQRMAEAAEGDEVAMPVDPTLVVTSTNNRAVDNVIEPLNEGPGLPLALRLGSRPVTETATVAHLERALRWLQAAPLEGALARWTGARDAMRDAWMAIDDAAREARDAVGAATRRGRLNAKIARLEADGVTVDDVALAAADEALAHIARMRRVLARTKRRLAGARKILPALVAALADAQIATEAMALPETPDELDDLEDVLDAADGELEARFSRMRILRNARTSLAGVAEHRDAGASVEAVRRLVRDRERTLLDHAHTMRDAWAVLNRQDLMRALRRLVELCRTRRSLRRALDDDIELRKALLGLFPVLGCTLLSLGNAFPLRRDVIDLLVIDEAGQCHPAYAAPGLFRAQRTLVIGDRDQLEPVITLDEHEEERVLRRVSATLPPERRAPYRVITEAGVSAQSLAERACGGAASLHDHFRCQPEIIGISDRLCGYDLRVRTTPASLSHRSAVLRRPVMGIRCYGDQAAAFGSWRNDAEVARVTRLVSDLLRDGIHPGQVAVLTPYRGQLLALRTALREARVPVEEPLAEAPDGGQDDLFADVAPQKVAIGTVHRFQGGERDVVVLSTVVSRPASLRFTNGRVNLLNVAISRARLHLLVVGNPEVLSAGPVTRELVRAIPPDAWLG